MDPPTGRLTLAMLATAGALVAGSAVVPIGVSAAATPAQCIRARVGPAISCLAAGKRCNPRYGHVYKLYDFKCTKGTDGHYQLHPRTYIGTPLP